MLKPDSVVSLLGGNDVATSDQVPYLRGDEGKMEGRWRGMVVHEWIKEEE